MSVIDDRGRVLGRANLIDVTVCAVALVSAIGLYEAISVFRLPQAPQVTAVEPRSQAARNGARVMLRGRDFLPFMRVFIEPSGDRPAFVHPREQPVDEFTLVNGIQAKFLAESPTTAAIELPDGIEPGTYDLAFYDETRRLSVARNVFTITPAPPLVSSAIASVRLDGRFARVTNGDAARLTVGVQLASGQQPERIEVLAIDGARRAVAEVANRDGMAAAPVEGFVDVPATVRAWCTIDENNVCRIGGVALAPAASVRLRLDRDDLTFIVDGVRSDLVEAEQDGDVAVRFVVRAESVAAIKAGDVDGRARLASIDSRRPTTSRTVVNAGRTSTVVEEPAVVLDATFRVPLSRVGGVWFYKNDPVKSGGSFAFETAGYKLRGWVLSVSVRPAAGRTESR